MSFSIDTSGGDLNTPLRTVAPDAQNALVAAVALGILGGASENRAQPQRRNAGRETSSSTGALQRIFDGAVALNLMQLPKHGSLRQGDQNAGSAFSSVMNFSNRDRNEIARSTDGTKPSTSQSVAQNVAQDGAYEQADPATDTLMRRFVDAPLPPQGATNPPANHVSLPVDPKKLQTRSNVDAPATTSTKPESKPAEDTGGTDTDNRGTYGGAASRPDKNQYFLNNLQAYRDRIAGASQQPTTTQQAQAIGDMLSQSYPGKELSQLDAIGLDDETKKLLRERFGADKPDPAKPKPSNSAPPNEESVRPKPPNEEPVQPELRKPEPPNQEPVQPELRKPEPEPEPGVTITGAVGTS